MLKHDLSDLFVNDGGNPIKPSEKLCDLGVKLDQTLSFDGHISAICQSAHFLIRNIARIRNLLSFDTCATLIYPLISSSLDYCNSLPYNIADANLKRLLKLPLNILSALETWKDYLKNARSCTDHYLPCTPHLSKDCSNTFLERSFSSATREWNSLDENIIEADFNMFKKSVKTEHFVQCYEC